jgi:hypothetical protein
MKIMIVKNVKYDFNQDIVVECDNRDTFFDDGEYVRMSETIEVEFSMIEADVTAAKVSLIDKDISKAKAGIELLEQTKAELLSIPDLRE